MNRLQKSLQARGVSVWRDKDRIRPGDRFAEALELGLATSRSVGLVVTQEGTASEWVKNEYYRALSLATEGQLQLIPLLFGNAEWPGFMRDRSWIDFRSANETEKFEACVNRLVWPGITGRNLLFVSICPGHGFPWQKLGEDLNRHGFGVAEAEDINRASHRIASYSARYPTRIVAVVDIFEGWPEEGTSRNSPAEYADFIFSLRDRTKGTQHEIVFLLHHNSEAFERADHKLSKRTKDRLQHYFTLHTDIPPRQRSKTTREVIFRIQRELLSTENPTA